MIRATREPNSRALQGDVIRNVDFFERVSEENGIIEISMITFPAVVVLTQDCDLEQDHNLRSDEKSESQDKWLISVLVAPLYNAEHVYSGEHLSELGISSQHFNSKKTPGRLLKQNQTPRYHYLEFPGDIELVPSVIDFKHYFAVSVQYLVEQKAKGFVCTVSELYREDISQRFAAFLSRIGLPEMIDGS
jgi:hypothetical protein